jgi:hypothetical protein
MSETNELAFETYIPYEEIGYDDENKVNDLFMEGSDELLEKLNEYVKDNNIYMERGDTVSLIPKGYRYRNQCLFVYNGDLIEYLDYNVDEYGAIHPHYEVTDTDFAPNYWVNTIDHNTYFYLSTTIKNRFKFYKDEHNRVVSDVLIGTKMWKAYIDGDNSEADESDGLKTMEMLKKMVLENKFFFKKEPSYYDEDGSIDYSSSFFLEMKFFG